MKIDEDTLISELLFMAGEFIDNRSNLQLRDVPSFEILNEMLAGNYGKYVDYTSNLRDIEGYNRYIRKYNDRSMLEYINFFAMNEKDIRRISTQYLNMLRKMRYPIIPYTQYIRAFSEKDFKDVIFGYYSQFGNEYYKLVKSYFDDNRINMGTQEMFSDHPAFFTGMQWIDAGYIFMKEGSHSCYSSLSATALVHELGHALDHSNFIVKQQKDIALYPDILSEVPSTAFEIGFLDYLKDNYIDIGGSIALNYGNIVATKEGFRNIKRAYNSGNPFTYCKPEDILQYMAEIDQYNEAVNKYNEEYLKHEDEILLGKYVELPEIPEEPEEPEPVLREASLYSLGYFFAYHLNAIRRSSNKEFIKVLNNITTTRKESTLKQTIAMTGFNYEDFVTGRYIKPQIEESAQILKKKYPY